MRVVNQLLMLLSLSGSSHWRRELNKKRNSRKGRERHGTHTRVGETPGKLPVRSLPQNQKHINFFIMFFFFFCDLPSKRTRHGKGRMTKINQNDLAFSQLGPFIPIYLIHPFTIFFFQVPISLSAFPFINIYITH